MIVKSQHSFDRQAQAQDLKSSLAMINCPNCNHQNPDGALQCEACYTPLPSLANCPNCNASIQADASFCGQCGSDLRAESLSTNSSTAGPEFSVPELTAPELTAPEFGTVKTQNFLDPTTSSESSQEIPQTIPEGLPDLISPDPLIQPEPIGSTNPAASTTGSFSTEASVQSAPSIEPEAASQNEIEAVVPETSPEVSLQASPEASSEASSEASPEVSPEAFITEPEAEPAPATPTPPVISTPIPAPTPMPARPSSATQLQVYTARLRQVQTDTTIEIPRQLSVVRIGKPNDHTPPDIDVSGFPDSEIVSRVHANIRVEGDTYYLEDIGSSNGTYINGLPLPVGNRHRLRPGDRIALGKGDKVSFIFENS
ncbi:MAG: FHA domain-containing protein [Cyanobacteria bacterium J06621_11]